ncbi:glycosyltransferase [Pseudodesulfovibrio sediminis]|uniref:Glycosyl transferase family 2 n=1 Tax=Pseudodesulfovibrio sediminis TaxID=2810563 RepID=A0ABM9SDJ9_9BACT|nr:glycosyltransferase [Pseudodesulfovibrio sediminis]BCS87448.1 glycosyl transferase family 2 [Pseudodesulfovibrio sediminis]
MQTHTVSIIVSDLETHPGLPRMLQSVSRQSIGLEDMEIVIIGNGSHPSSALSTWKAITGIDAVRLFTADQNANVAVARNAAAETTESDLLLFLRPDYRLDPKYMTTAFAVFEDHPNTDLMYADYIRLAPRNDRNARPGMIQLPSYRDELLQTRGFLGPAVIMTHTAWESTQGFREHSMYQDWDMWVQAALAGNEFYHVSYPLASCEHRKVSFRERAEDGRSKAMIVINNQGFFHMHTVRWALAYLRGESWSEAFGFMTIPGPMDVTRMLHDHAMKTMGTDIMAKKAIHQFDQTAINSAF